MEKLTQLRWPTGGSMCLWWQRHYHSISRPYPRDSNVHTNAFESNRLNWMIAFNSIVSMWWLLCVLSPWMTWSNVYTANCSWLLCVDSTQAQAHSANQQNSNKSNTKRIEKGREDKKNTHTHRAIHENINEIKKIISCTYDRSRLRRCIVLVLVFIVLYIDIIFFDSGTPIYPCINVAVCFLLLLFVSLIFRRFSSLAVFLCFFSDDDKWSWRINSTDYHFFPLILQFEKLSSLFFRYLLNI